MRLTQKGWQFYLLPCVLPLACAAQNFVGTNQPGQGTAFTFSIGATATNLSLSVSNSTSTFSHLLLKRGGAPTDTDYDFISQLDGQTNSINLVAPEFVATNYGLRVRTPSNSTAQAFTVVLSTNRADLGSVAYPILKPVVFSTSRTLGTSPGGAWHYFQVDMPTNLVSGWRIALSSSGGNPDLFVRRGQLPTQFNYDKASVGETTDTILFTDAEAIAQTYFIGVFLPTNATQAATYTLSTELGAIITLSWDPGQTHLGTQVFTNTSSSGGNYFFKIITQDTTNGVWRTALNVSGGEADVYLRYGALPDTTNYFTRSIRVGSDGFVLAQGGQFSSGQTWYLMVRATPGAQWNLVTGEAYVLPLPPLAADASSGTNVTMGAEGMRFFKTTISSNTLAWRLYLNGLTNTVLVRKPLAPVPLDLPPRYYDLQQPGQMLVVPAYLNIGDQYFVGVVGNPGLNFTLDSRQQAVSDLAFTSVTNLSVSGYGYTTFRVQVPVQQIAWQVAASSSSGDANVSARRDNVPNEFVNDAESDLAGGVADSFTMVPQGLSDGTFYVTVYGNAPYTCSLSSGVPVITDVNYVFSITNDAPNRAGWRFYRVVDTAQQLGSLGWELDLSGAPPGTELALRRNAVPGRWNFRNNPFNYPPNLPSSSPDYVTVSRIGDFLQRPNHQADIWYIGVYSPTNPLGSFVLTGSQLTGPLVAFDGTNSTYSVTNRHPEKWHYFRIDVPSGPLGWDLRIVNVTSGDPGLVVRRDTLADGYYTTYPPGGWPYGFNYWPSSYQWAAGGDWTGYSLNADGSPAGGRMIQTSMGNPLEPGTYYIGVIGGNSAPVSYTLVSRGIGTNLAIPVNDLSFSNGIAINTNLPAREAAYYRVVVPSNAPSWKLRVGTNTGEALLLVKQDLLPNVFASEAYTPATYGGRKMQKAGNEHYLLMPDNNTTNLAGGTYYLAVASEGLNPTGGRIGTGSSSYSLSSGVLNVTDLGTLDSAGATDLATTQSNENGEFKAVRFTVPPGTLSMEVYLENVTGYPGLFMRADDRLPGGYYYFSSYGWNGGAGFAWITYGFYPSLINLVSPTPTNYTLMVQGGSSQSESGYRVRVHAVSTNSVAFDGGTYTVANQPAGTWRYFVINVPTNTLGWDLRLTNVVAGADPQMIVRRDALPPGGGVWNPVLSAVWPSSNSFGASVDWTGEYLKPDGSPEYVTMLAMGMGNPLEPGTYYIGVQAGGTYGVSPSNSYTLLSRGIGAGFAIPVTDLALTNGAVTNLNLAAREAAYYRIVVPTNVPNWKLRLATNSGDCLLLVQKDALPNSQGGNSTASAAGNGGRKMKQVGNEHYLLLPENNPSNIVAGTYYLAVVSEGINPAYNRIGSNSSSFTLTSGMLDTIDLGTLDKTGASDLIENTNSESGELRAFRFTVPPDTYAMEVRLTNFTGSSYLAMRADQWLPIMSIYPVYGLDGGQYTLWNHYYYPGNFISVSSPVATNYTVMVQGQNSTYLEADYRLRIHAIISPILTSVALAFDVGVTNVSNQAYDTWRYFEVHVPTNALGWDLRLTNVTSGNPQMTVRRDALPPGGPYWNPSGSATWPSSNSWSAAGDWTGKPQDAQGNDAHVNMLAMGMGNPLEPGTYFVGVYSAYNQGEAPASYSLLSRGIGDGFAIPVNDLALTNGGVFSPSLPAREAAYYRVMVPTNMPSWKLRLATNSGDCLLLLQKDALPNSQGYALAPPYSLAGGRMLQRTGNEHYLLLPASYPPSNSNIVGGTYYLAVVSEGDSPSGSRVGANPSAFTLTSYGVANELDLGTVGAIPINDTNVLEGGEMALYRFAVPPGPQAVEVRLDHPIGSPIMNLRADTLFAGNHISYPFDYYGTDGGAGVIYYWSSYSLITLPNVLATNYTLTLQTPPNSASATYTLHIRQMPVELLNFDASFNTNGYTNVVSGSLIGGQHVYYRVEVPATNNGQAVVGWRLNLSQITGSPTLGVYPNSLPPPYSEISSYASGEYIVWPPVLTPGVWYVDLVGSGDSAYTLTSSQVLLPPRMNFGPNQNTNGFTNVVSGTLASGRSDFYEVLVPVTNNGHAVIGWKLDLTQTLGTPSVRVRPGLLPANPHGPGYTAQFSPGEAVIVPPYLTPGLWYIEVQASGTTSYTLTSDELLLARPTWEMPTLGGSVTTPGLPASGPLFGDTGVGTNGVALPGDQGVDLAEGNFDYYAINVPSNNIGLVRTRLDAISANPNLYIRLTNAPTLSHNSSGSFGTLYDRSLTAAANSEYGNWVPLNGRYEAYLPPGMRYLAVQAAGGSNVRYRLRISTGDIQDLSLAGGSFTNQTIAAGDWRYYRVQLPTNAPVNWNVTFGQQFGDVVMNVRDRVPPGQASSINDYRDWANDNKNHGPYASYDFPGTYNFTTPPLRPRGAYYLGFRAVNDATFSVSCTTNGGSIGYTNAVAFYGGYTSNVIPPFGGLKLRIDVPDDAYRWKSASTHSSLVSLYLEQGSVPSATEYHWSSGGNPNSSLNNYLRYLNFWPWVPGVSYFLLVTNTSGDPQPFSLTMDGRNAVTDDEDGDGLPDSWELQYFGNTYPQTGSSDYDGDGVSNLNEYLEGTNPADNMSFNPRLTVLATNGTVTINPNLPYYAWGTNVTLTATPNAGFGFAGWSGDASGNANPLSVMMNTNKSITASFTLTTPPRFTRIRRLDDGTVELTLEVIPGVKYRIQAATSPLDWVTLTTLPATTNVLHYVDTSAAGLTGRFYRAVSP